MEEQFTVPHLHCSLFTPVQTNQDIVSFSLCTHTYWKCETSHTDIQRVVLNSRLHGDASFCKGNFDCMHLSWDVQRDTMASSLLPVNMACALVDGIAETHRTELEMYELLGFKGTTTRC